MKWANGIVTMQISGLNPGITNILKQKAVLEFWYLPKKPQCKEPLFYYKLQALALVQNHWLASDSSLNILGQYFF